ANPPSPSEAARSRCRPRISHRPCLRDSVSSSTADAGRVLGLDLGDARIGVAISDPDRKLAVPLGTVATGAPQDLKAIRKLVTENDITLIVVGHPISMSGA